METIRSHTLKGSEQGSHRRLDTESKSVKKIYDGYSRVYDSLFKGLFFGRIRHAVRSMGIRPGDRVLDVGVGTGISLPLFPRHARVVGIDLSTDMLAKARKKIEKEGLTHIEVIEMDAMDLDFADDSFDKVFISHVVSVVPDPYKVMAEVRRVCTKDGLIVIVNHFRSDNKVIAGVEKALNPISKKIGWRSDLGLEEFIEKSGLKVKKKYKLRKIDFWHVVFAINAK